MKRKRLHRRRPQEIRMRMKHNGLAAILRMDQAMEEYIEDSVYQPAPFKAPMELGSNTIERIWNLWMDKIRSDDEFAKFYNSVADLKEIQSKFEQLEARIIKERERLAVLYSPIERLDDELRARRQVVATAIEANYRKLCEQLYSKRFQIVNGLVPVKNYVKKRHAALRSSCKDILKNEAMKKAFEDVTQNKGVPNFWLTVMKAKPVLREQINGHDEEVLKFLKDIKLCQVDKPVGLKLEFDFAENPFFRNQVLTKIYHTVDEKDLMPQDVIGTVIEWYGDGRLVECESSKSSESFFDFFCPPIAYVEFHNWRRHDNEIKCALQDIIHSAISYFVEKDHLPILEEEECSHGSRHEYGESEEEEEDEEDESFYEFEYQIGEV